MLALKGNFGCSGLDKVIFSLEWEVGGVAGLAGLGNILLKLDLEEWIWARDLKIRKHSISREHSSHGKIFGGNGNGKKLSLNGKFGIVIWCLTIITLNDSLGLWNLFCRHLEDTKCFEQRKDQRRL